MATTARTRNIAAPIFRMGSRAQARLPPLGPLSCFFGILSLMATVVVGPARLGNVASAGHAKNDYRYFIGVFALLYRYSDGDADALSNF